MKSSKSYNNSNIIKDENIDFSKFFSQNSFFPPTPENNRIYKFYLKDNTNNINSNKEINKSNNSIINRIELLKETLVDVISGYDKNDLDHNNINNKLNIFKDRISKEKKYSYDTNNNIINDNNIQYTHNLNNNIFNNNQFNDNNNFLNKLHSKSISQSNLYLNFNSINNKKNAFLPIENKFYNHDILLKKNFDKNKDQEIEQYNSLSVGNDSSNFNEQNSIYNDIKIDNSTEDSYNSEVENMKKSNIQWNKTFSNSSIAYDKSTFMSNKTYVNLSFDKSNCKMNTPNCQKVLGEINNILDSRINILNEGNDDNFSASPIHNYQISTMGCKVFPETFDKTLTLKSSNSYDNKKMHCFNYDGFFDENNDPFNSNVDDNDIDIFNKYDDEQDQESTKFNSFSDFNLKDNNKNNNDDEELDKIIDQGGESSFIDFKPYELYMNAFYSNNDIDFSNSKDSEQGKNPRNTILTKDVIESLTSSSSSTGTSLSSFSDSSLGLKKTDLDIRFSEDNQIKAEHIANMTPGTFFGLRSAPLGCLDGESLTPSQRPLYKYFTPQSELNKTLLSESISYSDHNEDNVSLIKESNEDIDIFGNINELSIFENDNENDIKNNKIKYDDFDYDALKPIRNNNNNNNNKKKSSNTPKKILTEKSNKHSLKQKMSNQTLVFLSTVMEQNGFEQQKYFIDFGNVKINNRKKWKIILQCDIVKVINWQLTQEKTVLEKKFTKDGNEFVQNHTLDIDSFSVNYTHGKVNPNREKTVILSFFPTAVGKYYKKIIINIGKHKILFNIEGIGISHKIVSFTDTETEKQANIKTSTNISTNNKYLILNEDSSSTLYEVENKRHNQELPVNFESVNNNLYNITYVNKENNLLFESTSRERIICFNIKRLLFNKVYNLKINNTSNHGIKIYFDNTLYNKNSNNFYVKFPEIVFTIPSKKCCFVPFKLFFNANSKQEQFSFYTFINCNNVSRKILISYKKSNIKNLF